MEVGLHVKCLLIKSYLSPTERDSPIWVKVKVKLTVKVKVTLEQASKAQRGSRGIAVLFNFGARWGE